MTVSERISQPVSAPVRRRDRRSDWAVVALVIVALLLGALLRNAVLYHTESFALDNIDLSGRYPAGWVRQYGDDPILRLRNPRSGGVGTTLELRARPLADDADVALVLDALALERAAAVEAYKNLGTEQTSVRGMPVTQRSFTYVSVDQNPYLDRLPVVVQGIDLVIRDQGRVVVATFLADVDEFNEDYRVFRRFVEDLEF